jgi:hypothetical protein
MTNSPNKSFSEYLQTMPFPRLFLLVLIIVVVIGAIFARGQNSKGLVLFHCEEEGRVDGTQRFFC